MTLAFALAAALSLAAITFAILGLGARDASPPKMVPRGWWVSATAGASVFLLWGLVPTSSTITAGLARGAVIAVAVLFGAATATAADLFGRRWDDARVGARSYLAAALVVGAASILLATAFWMEGSDGSGARWNLGPCALCGLALGTWAQRFAQRALGAEDAISDVSMDVATTISTAVATVSCLASSDSASGGATAWTHLVPALASSLALVAGATGWIMSGASRASHAVVSAAWGARALSVFGLLGLCVWLGAGFAGAAAVISGALWVVAGSWTARLAGGASRVTIHRAMDLWLAVALVACIYWAGPRTG